MASMAAVAVGRKWWRRHLSLDDGHGLSWWFGHCGLQVGPTRFNSILCFSKTAETCKFKKDAFHCSKKSQILHEDRMEYSEQNFQLFRLLVPNSIYVKILQTDSNLNLP
jgi:hypothetical protein